MDFLKLLRSLEELLFEALSWLVFYPITLWRTLVSPVAMMSYSDVEQNDPLAESYSDTLSPGIFLLLTLALAHALELAIGIDTDFGGRLGEIAAASDENLLLTRALMFGLFPLIFSVLLLLVTRQKIDRNQLRAPFFAQCYTTSCFALLFNLGMAGFNVYLSLTTLALLWLWLLLISVWFVTVQAIWLRRRTGMGHAPAAGLALAGFIGGLIMVTSISALLTGDPETTAPAAAPAAASATADP